MRAGPRIGTPYKPRESRPASKRKREAQGRCAAGYVRVRRIAAITCLSFLKQFGGLKTMTVTFAWWAIPLALWIVGIGTIYLWCAAIAPGDGM